VQTAFQSNAFQVSGFQIVAETSVEERNAGGWATFRNEQRALRLRYERETEERRRAALRRWREREKRRKELEREIAALEAHIAEAENVSRETIRLKSRVRKAYLPPYAAAAVQRALEVQSAQAFQYAELALRRVERDEDEEFAVLWALLH
jgi:hypothetical protein